MSEQAKTREEHKKLNSEEQKPTKQIRVRVRLIPIWLRLVLLIVLIFISVTAGALIGYGSLGGGKAIDVFKLSTWTHIRDFIDKK